MFSSSLVKILLEIENFTMALLREIVKNNFKSFHWCHCNFIILKKCDKKSFK
jgi:hypothetical protein